MTSYIIAALLWAFVSGNGNMINIVKKKVGIYHVISEFLDPECSNSAHDCHPNPCHNGGQCIEVRYWYLAMW